MPGNCITLSKQPFQFLHPASLASSHACFLPSFKAFCWFCVILALSTSHQINPVLQRAYSSVPPRQCCSHISSSLGKWTVLSLSLESFKKKNKTTSYILEQYNNDITFVFFCPLAPQSLILFCLLWRPYHKSTTYFNTRECLLYNWLIASLWLH